ncbi:Nuclease associated modular domain [Parasponia andersonii]|uniref:Nuclease associated modular domain n=1 Tax=Parasponia andersonii TaxID=3476 RepID=A0A2P5BA86_PARAD|nr:Nuclease associated modular domain [Parasponia andersonii]
MEVNVKWVGRFSISHSPSNCIQQNLFWRRFGYLVEYRHFPLVRVQSNHDVFIPRNWCSSISLITSFSLPRLNSLGALHISVDTSETSDIDQCCQSMVDDIDSSADQILLEEVLAINRGDSLESLSSKDIKERQRREKIGRANRGKVPWNKGRKHSAETRERIKQRTIEALNNPKVRKKMAERPRAHSNQVKVKIRSSLRRVWAKRLNWKRSREKIFHSWAESIAEAARTGGPAQEELEWESYDKIKQELVEQQLHLLAEEKIKVKELAKMIRAEKAAQAIAERMEKVARKRKLREERIKEKEERAKVEKKLNQDKKDSTRKLKLQQRLSQLRQNISLNGQVSSQKVGVALHIPAWEKLDLEHMKGDSLRREYTLSAGSHDFVKLGLPQFPTKAGTAHYWPTGGFILLVKDRIGLAAKHHNSSEIRFQSDLKFTFCEFYAISLTSDF